MLGRLMKYEFLATGRQIIPAYMGVVLFAVLNRILIEIGGGADQIWDGAGAAWAGVASGLLIFFYALGVCTVGILTFVLIIRRFYINLFKDEGYLTNTLPVSVDTHIWGKLIPAACWSVASGLVIFVSLWIMLGGLLREFTLWQDVIRPTIQIEPLFAALWLLSGIVGLLAATLAFYSALSIGQLAKRRKILLAIGAYFGMSFAFSIVTSFFSVIYFESFGGGAPALIGLGILGATANDEAVFIVTAMGLSLLQGAIHYVITRQILKNKLNLE